MKRQKSKPAARSREPIHPENMGHTILELLDLINAQVSAVNHITMAANNPPPLPEYAPAHLGVIALCLNGHLAGLREIQGMVKHLHEG